MSRIELLAVEIQLEICAKLCLHCRGGSVWASDDPDGRRGQAALAALSTTCRRLQTAAETVLYHSPVNIRRYLVLVRTLLARPHLRTCVKQLSDINQGTRFASLDKRALILLERTAQVLRLATAPETVPPGRLLAGILLCLATRLDTLSHGISVIGRVSNDWRAQLIPMARTGLPSLRALRFFREAVPHVRDHGYGYTLSEPSVCALLEAAPSLRHLAFEASVGARRDHAESPFTSGDAWLYDDDGWLARPLRRLETLAFVGCDMDDDEHSRLEFENLRRMARLSPCLRRFKYDGAALSLADRSEAADGVLIGLVAHIGIHPFVLSRHIPRGGSSPVVSGRC